MLEVAAAGAATDTGRISSAKVINAKIVGAGGLSSILCVLEEHAPEFSLINTATALHRLAKVGRLSGVLGVCRNRTGVHPGELGVQHGMQHISSTC